MQPLTENDPRTVGGYRLRALLGTGGMGRVYLGESRAGDEVAVKVIKPSALDEEARARFALEVHSLKGVMGARVAAFAAADAEADQPWLAVEYVAGPDLRALVWDAGPLPVVETASLGALLTEGLDSIHRRGLLHRDLKPQNVVVAKDGPKIIDFGLAVLAERRTSLTAKDTVVGSVVCMSPEQARGEFTLTTAVDIHALGATLLYAATGHYPYSGPSWHPVALAIADPATAPDLSGLPAELTPLLSAMLASDPAERPTSAAVLDGLVGVIEQAGTTPARARRLWAARVPERDDVPELPAVPA
ncbi:serine/threonine-protein kinase, partial [Streptomyces sp. SM12]